MLPCRLWAELCGSRLVDFSFTHPGDVVFFPLTGNVCVCVLADNTQYSNVVSFTVRSPK